MGPFAELIAIDHRQALEFFAVRLQDISEPDVDREELLYNASVLAHYAQTSTCAATDLGTPANLSEVFDHFVFDSTLIHDAMMMETAGAQCLLLAGFFEDQMSGRHNIRWYAGARRRLLQPRRIGRGIAAQGASADRASRTASSRGAAAMRASAASCAISPTCFPCPSRRRLCSALAAGDVDLARDDGTVRHQRAPARRCRR